MHIASVAIVLVGLVIETISRRYQLIKSLSFNFRDANSTWQLNRSYKRYGDVARIGDGLLLTPFAEKAFGLIVTREAIHCNKFELQVTFRRGENSHDGLLMIMWFFKDESNETFKPMKVESQLGFGIEVMTKPKASRKAKTMIKLLLNNKNTEGKNEKTGESGEDEEEEKEEYYCYRELSQETKLTLRYDNGAVTLFFQSKDNFLNHCFSFNEKKILGDSFKFGFESRNDKINDVILKDSISLKKVSFFNSNAKPLKQFSPTVEIGNSKTHSDSRRFHLLIDEVYHQYGNFSSNSLNDTRLNYQIELLQKEKKQLNTIQHLSIVLSNLIRMTQSINNTIDESHCLALASQQATSSTPISSIDNASLPLSPIQNARGNESIGSMIPEINSNQLQMEKANVLLKAYYEREIVSTSNAFTSNVDSYFFHFLLLCALMAFQFLILLWLNKTNH